VLSVLPGRHRLGLRLLGFGRRLALALRGLGGLGALGPAAHAAASQGRALGLDGAQLGQPRAGRRAKELFGEADGVHGDRHEIAGDRLLAIAMELLQLGPEDESDRRPIPGLRFPLGTA